MHKARFALAFVGLAAVALTVLPLAPTALADDLAEDLARQRADRTLSVDPADERVNRLNTPGTSAVTPFTMTPDGANTDFTTSLSQWRSSLSAADEDKLKAASDASGANLPVPQQAKSADRKLDVWAQGRHEQTGGATQEGNALTTFMGADYRVDRDVLIGGMFQVDEAHQGSYAAAESAKSTAYMAGPYVAYRLTPHLQLDANAAWGLGQDTTTTDGGSTAFDTQRMLSEAKITGNWGWRGWQLSQTGAVTYLDETGNGLGGVPGTSVGIARLSVGPEVKRWFGNGDMSIEPFAFFKSSVDLSDAGLTDPNALNKVGGGVTLAKPDDYSIKATADYSEGTGSTDPGVAQGKVSVSVPTSVLGF